MKFLRAWLAVLLLASSLQAEIRPFRPVNLPRFMVGANVRWADGSRGQIVGRAQWHGEEPDGQWYYPVQFGADGLCWALPESGLELDDLP
jgi:hypothetical protein